MACKKGSPSISANSDIGGNVFDVLFREHAAIMLLIEPDTGEILDANQSALDFYCYSRVEITGKFIHEINVIRSVELADEQKKALSGAKDRFVFQQKIANGEIKTVEMCSSFININEKKSLLSVIHDVTERKKTEEALKQSESHFQLLADHMSDTIWLMDMDLRVTYASPSAMLTRGYSLAELQNISMDRLLLPGSLQKVLKLCAEEIPKIKADKTYSPVTTIELEVRKRDGGIDLMELKLSLIRDEFGVPVSILGQGRNITERKRVEVDLRQSESRYRALFESSLSGILITNPIGAVIAVNPEACRLLGRTELEIYQVGLSKIFDLTDSRFDLAMKERERTGSFCSELTLIRGDGTAFPADVKSRSFTLPSGDEYSNIFFHDVSIQKQVRESLRRRTEELTALQETILELSTPHSLSDLLNLIVERAATLLDSPSGGLYLNEPEHQRVLCVVSYKTKRDYTGTTLDYGVGAAGIVAATGAPLIVDDYRKWDGRARVYEGDQPFQAVMSAPMLWQGRVSGVIHLLREDDNKKFTHAELSLLQMFANHAAAAVENARLLNLLGLELAERKQIENELRESEDRYHTIVSNSPLITFVVDECGVVSLVEGMGLDLLGLKPGQSVGRSVFDFSPEFPGLMVAIKGALGGQGQRNEINVRGAVFDVSLTPIFDDQGTVKKVIGVANDITSLKKTEEIIRRSEEKYRTVAEFTYDWESWRAPDGSYLYVSPSCERITGYTMEEFLNEPGLIYKITHPDDRDLVREHTNRVMGDQHLSNTEFDFRIVTPTGETRWINHSCISVFGADGRWLGRRESNRDVSERVRIAQELQAQRDFATQVINAMGQGLTVTDSQGRFEFVNAAYARLFGYEAEELIGKYPKDVTIPEEWGALENQRKLREDGQTSTYESRIQKADGGMAHVLITAVPRKSDSQNYGGAIAVITDLTEQKRVQDELRKARDAFEMANHQLQQALTREQDLSHTDGLTGVYNRRYFFELAEKWFGISIRHKQPLSALMIDIDHFKQVNDEFGHAVGDEVIRLVIRSTRDELRSEDIVGRYGGEEFVVILPMTNLDQAKILAERVRALAESLHFPTDKGEARITLSIGAAEMPFDQKLESVEFLIRNADKAMYIAKQDGRNRVRVFTAAVADS